MKRIEIRVMRANEALTAFAATWHTAESGGEPPPRLAFDSLRALFSAITSSRLELLRQVADRQPADTVALSRVLGRPGADVEADVAALVALGLLERNESGSLHAPFDEMVIHAGIRDAA